MFGVTSSLPLLWWRSGREPALIQEGLKRYHQQLEVGIAGRTRDVKVQNKPDLGKLYDRILMSPTRPPPTRRSAGNLNVQRRRRSLKSLLSVRVANRNPKGLYVPEKVCECPQTVLTKADVARDSGTPVRRTYSTLRQSPTNPL